MEINHIYVIHYREATNRKTYLDTVLPHLQIPYSYRSLYDRDSPELQDTQYFLNTEENRNTKNSVMQHYGKIVEIGPVGDTVRGRAYRAATLEHFKTYEFILNETNFDHVLILEDDVRFKDGFKAALDEYQKVLPEDYDVCYLGSGCNLQLPYKSEKIIDLHPQKHSRCSDSYIVKRSALEKIVKTALPFFGAIDWDLNYIQMVNNFNVYWVTNPLVYQGSQHGHYESCFHILN